MPNAVPADDRRDVALLGQWILNDYANVIYDDIHILLRAAEHILHALTLIGYAGGEGHENIIQHGFNEFDDVDDKHDETVLDNE